jgi:hypothetical protein
MPTEIKIVMKNEDSSLIKKFLSYQDTDGDITLSYECEKLKSMIDQSKAAFEGIPDSITVKASFEW